MTGLGLALVLAAPTSASVRLGLTDADLAGPLPNGSGGTGYAFNDSLSGGRVVAAPADGVITNVKVVLTSVGGAIAWRPRIVHPNGLNFDWPGPIIPSQPYVGGLTSVPERAPVAAGDIVAIEGLPAFGLQAKNIPETGFSGSPTPAYLATNVPPSGPIGPTGFALALGADWETDADRDGFGDDTQDACPTDPKRQDACPPAAVVPPAAVPAANTPPKLTSCTKPSQALATQAAVRGCVRADELAALTMTGKLVANRKTFDLGRTGGAVAPGNPAVLELKLARKAVAAVRKSGGQAKLSLIATDAQGAKSLTQVTVSAKATRRRKR